MKSANDYIKISNVIKCNDKNFDKNILKLNKLQKIKQYEDKKAKNFAGNVLIIFKINIYKILK